MFKAVFAAVFIAQIIIIALVFTRTVLRLNRSPSLSKIHFAFCGASILVAAVGVALLIYLLDLSFQNDVTQILLVIGLFFAAQVAPFAIAIAGGLFPQGGLSAALADTEAHIERSRWRDFISGPVVATAVVLMLAVLGIVLRDWTGDDNKPLFRAVMLVFVNVFFCVLFAVRYRTTVQSSGPERVKLEGELSWSAKVFALMSIGISTYYLGKELLFFFELHEWRPTMMSAYLQLLVALAIPVLIPKQS